MSLKNKIKSLGIIVLFIVCIQSNAQFTQRIRGVVVDGALQKPVVGATVYLLSANKIVRTDSLGNFCFTEF